MPNPLMTNKGKTRTQEVQKHEPVIEQFAGENNPYRGTNDHGVPVKVNPPEMPDWDNPEIVEYEAEERLPEPVPVRIVSESAKELRKWRHTNEFVDSTQRRIVGAWDKRTTLKIANQGPATVFIAPDSNVSAMNGYPLAAGKDISLTTTDDVWAIVVDDTETDAHVAVLMEYTVEA